MITEFSVNSVEGKIESAGALARQRFPKINVNLEDVSANAEKLSVKYSFVADYLDSDSSSAKSVGQLKLSGVVELKEGVIRAAIHAHMSPQEAAYFGVKQGDMMKLRVGGPSGVTFNSVHVRIDPTSRLNVHMDTDEANACGLHLTKDVEIFK